MADWAAGADGCKAGWFCVRRNQQTGEITSGVFTTAQKLIHQEPVPAVLTIDIPIGLLGDESSRQPEPPVRACDVLARRLLGPRRSSVFAPPLRQALTARSRQEASDITEAISRKKVAAQAFAIYPKIREVDSILVADPFLQARVREVHPEVCFWAWNGKQPMSEWKRTPEGWYERRRLLDAWLGEETYDPMRAVFSRGDVASDDILDALAALWTAERILRGEARTLPEDPPVDAPGLRMEMVY